jgi:alkanesulfonate monooxygenase SsuD/methylene tetrahydromethanopterin reductase-like flavin-dependent oxidoreductase (luciferase family)
MDQTGYDAVWLAEHHFNTYSVCPSTTLMGMHVAARTKRLRIGTAVTLAGFYHPLRLAEELALLDNLSGGRLNWGAGRGYDATEFRAFGVKPEESAERMRECRHRARGVSRQPREPPGHGVEDVECCPSRAPASARGSRPRRGGVLRAAESGFSILMDPPVARGDQAQARALPRDSNTMLLRGARSRSRACRGAPTDEAALAAARGRTVTLGYAKIPGLPADRTPQSTAT